MENEIRKIRDAVAQLRKHKGMRYSAELRADLVRVSRALRAEGKSWTAIAVAFGVGHYTPRRLCEGKSGKKAVVDRAAFLPVAIRELGARAPSGLSLTSPSGYRVEGLDIGDVAQLLARFS